MCTHTTSSRQPTLRYNGTWTHSRHNHVVCASTEYTSGSCGPMATMKEAITGLQCLSAGCLLHGVEMQSQGLAHANQRSGCSRFRHRFSVRCSVASDCEKANKSFLNSTIHVGNPILYLLKKPSWFSSSYHHLYQHDRSQLAVQASLPPRTPDRDLTTSACL
jgi:hypothetical protein